MNAYPSIIYDDDILPDISNLTTDINHQDKRYNNKIRHNFIKYKLYQIVNSLSLNSLSRIIPHASSAQSTQDKNVILFNTRDNQSHWLKYTIPHNCRIKQYIKRWRGKRWCIWQYYQSSCRCRYRCGTISGTSPGSLAKLTFTTKSTTSSGSISRRTHVCPYTRTNEFRSIY